LHAGWLTDAVRPRTPPRFDEDSERYDRVRPSYPAQLVDDVIALAQLSERGRALEVGAGTGKATVMFADRGVTLHALEPSPAMARIARRNCRRHPNVTFEETGFERWRAPGRRFELVFSAQAWHWVAPSVRCARAREALLDGGLLAVFWSRPDWEHCGLRDRMRAAYARAGADLGPDPGPLHPGSEIAPHRYEDWDAEIASARGLAGAEVRHYESSLRYTTDGYLELLRISRDHAGLPDSDRAALLTAVGRVIDDEGGLFAMNYVTQLCLARARRATIQGDGEQ
jgi:SAM-dependent methyltransferase